jgi:organic radical activating enzyme
MLSFPLRLRAELLRARILQSLRGKAVKDLVVRVNPAVAARFSGISQGAAPAGGKSDSELWALLRASAAPIVWIGGGEPFLQPAIGNLARRIADSGHTVFVETDGVLLRRRIHEFRPISRLFVTVKFHGLEQVHDLRSGRAGVFRAAVEGIRTAKLSGFLICAHALIDEETRLEDIAQLKGYLTALDADGFLVSAAPDAVNAANRGSDSLRSKVIEARKLIGNPGWERFSRLLELQALPAQDSSENAAAAHLPQVHEESTREESVRVS